MMMAPPAASQENGRSLFMIVAAIAALATLSGRTEAFGLTARSSFTTGSQALNLIDAAGGSGTAPRAPVNTQGVGLDFPGLAGPMTFGMFYSRTAFDSGFGPFTVQAMGVDCHRPVFGPTIFGLRTGEGIANGSGATNRAIALFEFFMRVPLGFTGVFLEIDHQMLVNLHGYGATNVYHADHVGVAIGGGK